MYKFHFVNSINNFLYDHYPFIKLDLTIQLSKHELCQFIHYLKHCDLQNLIQQN
jgi:hypothetical protein